MRKLGLLLCVVMTTALPVTAQVQWAGTLDIAHKVDIAQDEGESDAEINKSLKGLSAFNLVRARFFADAEITEGVAALTTILWDEELEHFDMEGAYVLFSQVRGHEAVNLQVGSEEHP